MVKILSDDDIKNELAACRGIDDFEVGSHHLEYQRLSDREFELT